MPILPLTDLQNSSNVRERLETQMRAQTSNEAYISRLKFLQQREKLNVECWQSYFSARIFYYSAQSLLLGGFLTFYGVDAFMDRDPCLTDDSQQVNVARRFTHIFKVCFYLHLTQFLTSASVGPLVDILLPMKQNREGLSYDTIMKEAGMKAQTAVVMIFEHILRAAVLAMAFW